MKKLKKHSKQFKNTINQVIDENLFFENFIIFST